MTFLLRNSTVPSIILRYTKSSCLGLITDMKVDAGEKTNRPGFPELEFRSRFWHLALGEASER